MDFMALDLHFMSDLLFHSQEDHTPLVTIERPRPPDAAQRPQIGPMSPAK
jgi:hypothetical protein